MGLCVVFRLILLFIVNHLLGYYVIALILSVITALITIYHNQIVSGLTPAAHKLKKSVLISGSAFFIIPAFFLLIAIPFSSLPGGWVIPIAILFVISFPPVRHIHRVPGHLPADHSRSSSVTKSSPFFVVSFGVFGLDLRSLQPAHFLENWATFSA